MTELKIGSEVRSRSGRLGRLSQVVLDRHTGEVSDLVVALQGDEVSVVLPRSLVVRVDDGGGIMMDMDSEDLAAQRAFRSTEFEVCDMSVSGMPAGGALYWLRRYGSAEGSRPALAAAVTRRWVRTWPEARGAVGRGTPVRLGDSSVAVVDHVLADDETGEITHLVVSSEGEGGLGMVVPAELVSSAHGGDLELNLDREQWATLTRYTPRPDAAIVEEVRGRLASVGCPVGELDISVEGGVVAIAGPAYDLDTKRAADEAVRQIEGVVGVDNRLTIDSGVAAAVTAALAQDPRTHLRAIDVAVSRGTVTLQGIVANRDESRVAESIARAVPGAQAVMNELGVDPRLRPAPEGLLVLHPHQSRYQGQ